MREPESREMIAAFGRYVRETRHLLGWSQERLADETRTSQGLISRVERGNCFALPFLTVLKVLSALAAVVSDIESAVPPSFRLVLACAAELPRPSIEPPDPQFAELLQTYHALPPARRAAFIQMLRPLAAMFEDHAPDEKGIA